MVRFTVHTDAMVFFQVFQSAVTHLIVPQVLSSEKFLAACAAGKWVVTPDYVLDSVRNGSWLEERPYEVAISPDKDKIFYPVRQWREKIARGSLTGAFQGWRVLLMVQDRSRRAMFKRLLKAGRAKVYRCPLPPHVAITHVMAKPVTENYKTHNAPCYPVTHIVQHLFGVRDQSFHINMIGFKTAVIASMLWSELLTGLYHSFLITFLKFYLICVVLKEHFFFQPAFKKCVEEKVLARCKVPFVSSFCFYSLNQFNVLLMTFLEILLLIFLVLFIDCLKQKLIFLNEPCRIVVTSERATLESHSLEHLSQGEATSFFLRNLQQVLHGLLMTNPPWLAPSTMKKYFSQVLQCPHCKTGLWPFLETETERNARQKLRLVENLLDLLSVLVEFWCQKHFKLNQNMVEKSLKDLAEHIALICQDVSSVVLADLVVRIPSTRLKLVTADAIFRSLCCRNGLPVGDEPLSLRKMVMSYLPALGSLGGSPRRADLRDEPVSHSWTSQGTGSGSVKHSCLSVSLLSLSGTCSEEPETLLHRACKRNQVETVLQILALPGTDVNVKDHAGWTPLHEACNHGSTACVEALLRHRPAPHLNSQVGGVSPLHDALLNGHLDIAKMLLEHAAKHPSAFDVVNKLSLCSCNPSFLKPSINQVVTFTLLELYKAKIKHLYCSWPFGCQES
uniref:SMC5-SMC6 complex localization factor 1 n=1 Tax=Myripristis murdjan TaxID=586833 RepID=A0A667YAE1_9TELE